MKQRTDIPIKSWIDRYLPWRLRPYAKLMRLDRPIGIWLLLLPGWWSLTQAGFGTPNFKLVALFFVGAIVMRGAGCTYNDIIDRDIDRQVERTRSRPLAAGHVTMKAAWIFLAVQLVIGLIILLQFNWFAMGVGAASLLLVAAYPFMKRITFWPQAWLGLTFNWGALLGWAATHGRIETPALWLYAAGFFWTLGYDTIYAHQDREDDALIGVRSSALKLGNRTKPFVAVCYLLTIGCLYAATSAPAYDFSYFRALVGYPGIAAFAFAALHLAWQAATLDINNPANCLYRFRSNRNFGLLVLVALALQRY